ncbi:MAG: P-II family nitrogen regulator [Planctomycetota bacterium]
MQDVKRVEIVIGKSHARLVRHVLHKIGVPGMTVFETLEGEGDRGRRDGGDVSDAMTNIYIITTCEPEQVDQIARHLAPLLDTYGGLCLLSDAQILRNAHSAQEHRRST